MPFFLVIVIVIVNYPTLATMSFALAKLDPAALLTNNIVSSRKLKVTSLILGRSTIKVTTVNSLSHFTTVK